MNMHEHDEVELAVTRLALGGKGVARCDGLVVFVDGGLPGATVVARVTKVKKGFAEAQALRTLTPSPQATEPRCPHFGVCGGCVWQDLDYAAQLFWKREQVVESLARLGGLPDVAVAQTVPSPQLYGYRNKMEFAFAGRLHLGLHERLRPGRVLDIETCPLMDPWAAELVAAVRLACRDTGLAAFDPRTSKGVWRHLVLRQSAHDGSRLAHLITGPSRGAGDAVHLLGKKLLADFPALTGFVHSVRRAPTAVAVGERQAIALGRGYLVERMGRATLRLLPDAFAQTNTEAAAVLYDIVAQAAGSDPAGTALDLYCGSGGVALNLAPAFAQVRGLDIDPRSVESARSSASLSEADNCVFKAGDAVEILDDLGGDAPAVVVLDPPRAGISPEVLAAILRAAPKRLVYVSCNPATLARDLKGLAEAYEVAGVTPVDLFPHTAHIEAVASLTLR
jgi:23S rRNA (uracil1939-C5)-methyltransferase